MPAVWDEDAWIDAVLDIADGLLLSGGGDVDPARYGSDAKVPLQYTASDRDAIETRLVAAAAERGVPVLGICRGAQLINVAFGGTLVQDVPSMRSSPIAHSLEPDPKDEHQPVHSVRLRPDSKVAAAYRRNIVDVNSMHHQAVDELGSGLVATGFAEDGLVEAIEAPDAWIVGVQWHPERMTDDHPEHRALFEAFVAATGDAAERGAA